MQFAVVALGPVAGADAVAREAVGADLVLVAGAGVGEDRQGGRQHRRVADAAALVDEFDVVAVECEGFELGSGDGAAGLFGDAVDVGHRGDAYGGIALRSPHGHGVIVARKRPRHRSGAHVPAKPPRPAEACGQPPRRWRIEYREGVPRVSGKRSHIEGFVAGSGSAGQARRQRNRPLLGRPSPLRCKHHCRGRNRPGPGVAWH